MTALVVAEGLLLLLADGPAASRVLPDHVPHCEGERRHPMLIQNVLRRPAEFTGAPPTIGPAALDSPDAARTSDRPRPPGGGPAGNVFVVVYGIAAGFSSTLDGPAGRGTR